MNIPEMEAVCKQVRRDIITMTAGCRFGPSRRIPVRHGDFGRPVL